MRTFLSKFLLFFVAAGVFSFFMNMLLLTPSLYMLQVYDRVLGSRSVETLWFLTLLLLAALAVMGSMELVRSRLLVRANNAIDAQLAPYLLRKMAEGATSPEGNQYSHGLRDLNSLKSFLTGPGILALFDAPWMPIAMIILWYMNIYLFLVALAGAVLMLCLTIANEFLTRKPLTDASGASQAAGRHVELALRNAEVVNAMGMLKGVTARWSGLNDRVLALQSKASKRAGNISGVTKFVRQAIQSLGLGAGAYVVLNDPTFTPGMMIAGTIVLGKALGPIELLIGGWKGFLEARIAYSRLDDFMKMQHLEIEPMELPPPSGQISLEKVSFGIRATNKMIIKDVSFALPAGEALGIIGPSAAGKSTLARMLVGVWKPLQGNIRLDGGDMNSWPSDRLGPYIGYLPQDIELFAGTIADNIARLDEPDSEKVIKAARLAGLHDMILNMPKGYDTYIGVSGAVLSGGQRQRIGLARAMYGDPKLIVLDEPNASLDNDGEVALLQAMGFLKKMGTTVVIITHKVSLLANVDKLLVMQDGAIAAFGPREGVLQHLLQQQQKMLQQQQAAQQQKPSGNQATSNQNSTAASTQEVPRG
ncbi:MAG: type I secretion system permease/ATPase [Desulfuromonadaceae bacterium]|nr:type I secretion system permease/ATPase [Desulfuromonadaceae bacterium]